MASAANPRPSSLGWRRSSAARPARPALIAGGRTVHVRRAVGARRARSPRWLAEPGGFQPGATVGLIGRNSPTTSPPTSASCARAASSCRSTSGCTPREIGEQLEFVGAGRRAHGRSADRRRFGGDRPGLADRRLPQRSRRALPAAARPTSPACILLTSGSTGRPKGVVHSHGTLLHAALQLADGDAVRPGERVARASFRSSPRSPSRCCPCCSPAGRVEFIDTLRPGADRARVPRRRDELRRRPDDHGAAARRRRPRRAAAPALDLVRVRADARRAARALVGRAARRRDAPALRHDRVPADHPRRARAPARAARTRSGCRIPTSRSP